MKINQKGFSAVEGLLILVIVGALAGVGWYVFNAQKKTNVTLSNTQKAQTEPVKTDKNKIEAGTITRSKTITSGKELYDITFPDGWSGIQRTLDSDLIIIPGQKQPEVKKDQLPEIKNVAGYGKNEPFVFRVQVYGNLVAPEAAEVTNFAIGKDDNSIIGKKYTTVYDADTKDSLGVTRIKGDRDYQYRFPIKEPYDQLVIDYKVYGSDPKNNIETLEQIIKSITFRRLFTSD